MSYLSKIRSELIATGSDAAIFPASHESQFCLDPTNYIKEITGFDCSFGYVVVTHDTIKLFLDPRYTDQARQSIQGAEICDYAEMQKWLKSCNDLTFAFNPALYSIAEIRTLECKKIFHKFACMRRDDETETIEQIPVNFIEKYKKAFPDGINGGDAWLICDKSSVAWLCGIRDMSKKSLAAARFALIYDAKYELFTDDADFSRFAKVYYEPRYTPHEMLAGNFIDGKNNIALARAIKSPEEIEELRKAHVQESQAFKKFLQWIDTNDDEKTEASLAKKLIEIRSESGAYVCESFAAIIAFGANSSCIHYNHINPAKITKGICLIDSGGQYKYGTMDTSRTIIVGRAATYDEKMHFTAVLKSFITVATMHFPIGTNGVQIDAIARYNMWQSGSSYAHATGHGVGHFLSVHESPTISSRDDGIPLAPGMTIAIEPGYYCNEYGIRTENVFLIKESDKFSGFLCMETLDFVPICHDLIDFDSLNEKEKAWLSWYDEMCGDIVL